MFFTRTKLIILYTEIKLKAISINGANNNINKWTRIG